MLSRTYSTGTQRKIKTVRRHAEIGLPPHIWVPLLVLLISTSPHSCSGACSIRGENPVSSLCNPKDETVTKPQFLQRVSFDSRRSPKRSSKTPSIHASNCSQNAIVPTVSRRLLVLVRPFLLSDQLLLSIGPCLHGHVCTALCNSDGRPPREKNLRSFIVDLSTETLGSTQHISWETV